MRKLALSLELHVGGHLGRRGGGLSMRPTPAPMIKFGRCLGHRQTRASGLNSPRGSMLLLSTLDTDCPFFVNLSEVSCLLPLPAFRCDVPGPR